MPSSANDNCDWIRLRQKYKHVQNECVLIIAIPIRSPTQYYSIMPVIILIILLYSRNVIKELGTSQTAGMPSSPHPISICIFSIYHFLCSYWFLLTMKAKTIKPLICILCRFCPIYITATEDKEACGGQCGFCYHTNHHSLVPKDITFLKCFSF